MKNFSIQKYFFNAPSFESSGAGKEIAKKSKITVGDGRLDKWELQIIEKAVEAKRAGVLQDFLQKNNVLFEEIVSELRNRIDRSSDGSGTKYVQSLLKVLQDNSAKTAEKPKMQVKYIPRSYAELGYAPNDPRVQSGEKLIIPVQVPVLNHSEAKPVYNETQVKFTQEDYQKHCADGKGGMFCEVMKYELNKQAKEQWKIEEKSKIQERSHAPVQYIPIRTEGTWNVIYVPHIPQNYQGKPIYNIPRLSFTQEDYQKHCADGRGGMFCELIKEELKKQAKEQENTKS